jgi:formylglycine-generating enzyme
MPSPEFIPQRARDRSMAWLAAFLSAATACGPVAHSGYGDDDSSGDSSGEGDSSDDGDGDSSGDGDAPCEPQHEGMICIPAGPFIMGSDHLTALGELQMPRQEVQMSQFHIDRHEVTFGQYRACVNAGVCTPPAAADPDDDRLSDPTHGCRWGQTEIDGYPVACVDWLQAVAYCDWRGATLPTEAQWEKAGRGSDGRNYPWGNEAPTCHYASMIDERGQWGCGTQMPQKPGSHSPQGDSPYGVQDMIGNVQELVADWLGPGQPNLGADPVGPDGEWKVSKGGAAFVSQAADAAGGRLHLAWRGRGGAPIVGYQLGPFMGFRCAISG